MCEVRTRLTNSDVGYQMGHRSTRLATAGRDGCYRRCGVTCCAGDMLETGGSLVSVSSISRQPRCARPRQVVRRGRRRDRFSDTASESIAALNLSAESSLG